MIAALTLAVVALWIILVTAPATPIARRLHRLTVVAPATRLSRVTPGQMLLLLGIATVGVLVALLLDAEGVRIATLAAPEIAQALASVEITAWLDVVAGLAMAGSTTRVRAIVARIGTLRPRTRPQSRPRSSRPRRPVDRAANDDEDRPARAA